MRVDTDYRKEFFRPAIRGGCFCIIAAPSSYSRGVFRERDPSGPLVRRREKACRAICDEVLAARCKLDMYVHAVMCTDVYIFIPTYVNTRR